MLSRAGLVHYVRHLASDDQGRAWPVNADSGPTLVLELTLLLRERLAGTVGLPGDPNRVTFHGWIELMIALERLRHAASAEPPPPGSV